LGNRLVVGGDSVVLLWAPGALSLVLLVFEGRRWWPLVAAADLVFSLTGTDVPAIFIPFTMAANVLGALAGATLSRHRGLGPGRRMDLASGGDIALCGLAMALASLPLGVAGLILAVLMVSLGEFVAPPLEKYARQLKVFSKNKDGLKGRFKIVGQIGIGIIVGATLYYNDDVVIREFSTPVSVESGVIETPAFRMSRH
jgi:hypothetical protein